MAAMSNDSTSLVGHVLAFCRSGTLARILGILALTTSVAPILSACGDFKPPHQPGGIVFVVGGRNNMPKPTLVKEAKDILHDSVLSKDRLVIVGVSGSPKVLYTEDMKHDCDSTVACNAVVDDYQKQVDGLFAKVKADSEEADPLTAIEIAAKQLASLKTSGPRQIVVVDNGVQTTGELSLRAPGALSVSPQEVAKHMAKDEKLQRLKGVEVLFTGLGSHYQPQGELSQNNIEKLEKLWGTVLSAGGATVTFGAAPLDRSAPTQGLPQVSPVSFDEVPIRTEAGCTKIREDQVGFVPDQATLLDQQHAREILTPIAQELRDKKLTATVIGTTAMPEDPPYPLSKRRAEVVVGLLVDLGVPGASLTAVGVGTNFAGFVPDTDSSGQLIPTLAVQNRLVIVQPVGVSCAVS
jgi:outer membrane protein OmpA-like peptidoglycan-associated protein